MENITIKVLASKLNLSATTISKALQDSHEISEPTKQRVRALAAALNYTPNTYARSLRTRKSETIAVVLPEITDHFFALVINGIETVAREKGYHVLIYLTHEDYNREKEILDYIKKGRIDGLLISVTKNTIATNHIAAMEQENIPVIFFDRVMEQMQLPMVVTNDFESCYQATQHLLTCGCKKISVCTISTNLEISKQRILGYQKAMTDNNIPLEETHVLFCDDDTQCYDQLYNTLKAKNRPDGLLAIVDKLTLPIYLACEKLNLKIPQDLQVISFSNNPTAGILNPSLTTISQPAFLIGQTAAILLLNSLDPKNNKVQQDITTIPSELIIRNSTGYKKL
ncbi:LacI family transcriptional regulator [Pedobacter cryoconitis]|uniref:LacI family transcriptional regulator n=1 Tax=Pedobacter cryoconitis TaxID=188932 RepID=A0A127V992_9SPHI|nr:LacI family DNA-binding transcriptional regulator [Pedobacter cryoconitis]AMP97864.1 LacI family transcriptional regulator [Pedobacter cryoconitis]